jgi:DnaJ like chaperone protein
MLGNGSIWGKVIGGVTGFMVGGPAGAMFGTVAGHALDKARDRGLIDMVWPPEQDPAPQVGFTTAFVILAAKMAALEGRSVTNRMVAFTGLFQVPNQELGGIAILFEQSRHDPTGFESYAELLAEMFADAPQTREELVEALLILGLADGPISIREAGYLLKVAAILGVDAPTVQRLMLHHRRPAPLAEGPADVYDLLGVSATADMNQVKAAYRRLMREHHPDTLTAQGAPAERIATATRKVAEVNAAYEEIRKRRGMG